MFECSTSWHCSASTASRTWLVALRFGRLQPLSSKASIRRGFCTLQWKSTGSTARRSASSHRQFHLSPETVGSENSVCSLRLIEKLQFQKFSPRCEALWFVYVSWSLLPEFHMPLLIKWSWNNKTVTIKPSTITYYQVYTDQIASVSYMNPIFLFLGGFRCTSFFSFHSECITSPLL